MRTAACVILSVLTVLSGVACADEGTAPSAEVVEPADEAVVVEGDGEAKATGLIYKAEDPGAVYYAPATSQLLGIPASYDARAEGFVTPIKNQGQCGSCAVFAKTKAHEAQAILAGTQPQSVDLSEQHPLTTDPTQSCAGGYLSADWYTKTLQMSDEQCRYTANDRNKCGTAQGISKATKWAYIGDSRGATVEQLKQAIYSNKVIVAAVAADGNFMNVRGDRVKTCTGTTLNHAITLVGYRPAVDGSGETEFLIANSWGDSWGDRGFAWSKFGCNGLAKGANTASMLYIEPVGPSPDPRPTPDPTPRPLAIELPVEIVAKRGEYVALFVRLPNGEAACEWSTGKKGQLEWVQVNKTASYRVSCTDAAGARTQRVVKVTAR